MTPFVEIARQQNSRDRPFIFVVDALDECGDDTSRLQIADCLCQIAVLADWFKVFVTSRPLPELTRKSTSIQGSIALDLNTVDAERDIEAYTRSCLKELVDTQNLDENWLNDDTVTRLSKRSSGLFIWMSTATRFIRGHYDQNDAMEMFLSGQDPILGSNLDSLYRAVIQNSRRGREAVNLPLMRIVLGTIFISSKNRPLTIDGLYDIMPALRGRSKFSKTTLKAIIGDLRSVLYEDSSKGNVIRVCHPSFLDFLSSSERCGKYWTNPYQLNQTVIEICLNIMRSSLKFNICNLKSSYVANKDVADFEQRVKDTVPESLQYSCLHWITHYKRADDVTCQKLILEFFQSLQLLYWLEVLSLIGSLKTGLETLRTVADIYKVCIIARWNIFSDDILLRTMTQSVDPPTMHTEF